MTAAAGGRERAPRLDAGQRLADHVTRTGRFASRDPRVGRPLPRAGSLLGVAAWAGFVVGVVWRARHGRDVP